MNLHKTPYYTGQGLWSLFLNCAFPLLFWTLLLSFRDVGWLTERTNAWDAVGVISYGLIFAVVESLLFFTVTVALGFLISRSWDSERRTAIMGALATIIALWAILAQSYFLFGKPLPVLVFNLLLYTGRPVLTMYIIALALVALSVISPVFFILRSDKTLKFFQDFSERTAMLTMFYLFLGFIGLIVVIIRNV